MGGHVGEGSIVPFAIGTTFGQRRRVLQFRRRGKKRPRQIAVDHVQFLACLEPDNPGLILG